MKTTIFNLLSAGLVAGLIFTGCSKENSIDDLNNNPQALTISDNGTMKDDGSGDDGTKDPESGMLNRDMGIVYAVDGKDNISSQFSGYTFRYKGQQPSGEVLASDGQRDLTGTWRWRDGTNAIVMDFPNGTNQTDYLNRMWTMQPSTSANMMKLTASDGDEIVMSAK